MPLSVPRRSPLRARVLLAALAVAVLGLFAVASAQSASAATIKNVKHVWVIALENNSYAYTFGKPNTAPYLSKTLASEGALVPNYFGTGHDSLDNYTALVSGQAPDYDTGQDCSTFINFTPFGSENYEGFTKLGQITGEGCVYPTSVKTVGDQLTAKHLGWKTYQEDMGNVPSRDGTVATSHGPACGHPKLGGIDFTDSLDPKNDSYADRHDPFVWFHSVIDRPKYCDAHVVSLTNLASDLKSVKTTPAYSFVTPNTCNDAHDTPKCQDGSTGGLAKADTWLQTYVPMIQASPAYKDGGMIVVTFDESGEDSDAGACCGEKDSLGYTDPSHPNVNEPGLYGPGGGRVGAVVLSPLVKPGTRSTHPYNHYSLLRTVEDAFGLKHLGDAQMPQVRSFGSDIFTQG